MPSPFGHAQVGDLATPPLFAVRASYTSNIADLTAATTTCDTSVTLVEGDLVALTEQSDASENGVYVVGAVSGGAAPLTRHESFQSGATMHPGTRIFVSEGTARSHREYVLTTDEGAVIGTDDLVFASSGYAAIASIETRLSADESTGELSSASVYESLTTRVSTEESTRASADTSLTTRVSTEECNRASQATSLTTRVSTAECTEASTTTSLTTRVSTEECARASAGTSLTTRISTEEAARSTADASLTTRVSTAECAKASSVTSIDTRISSLIASIDA